MIAIMSALQTQFDDAPSRDLVSGETLFRREAPVRSVFFVRSGSIALERPLADGTALTLHVGGTGTLLAEGSLFADAYHCDAVARGPARVAATPKSDFLAALRASPDMVMELLERSAREVQAHRARIEILRLRRVADRLDAWLDLHGRPTRGEWSRVAEAIGVTPSALYRELAKRRQSPSAREPEPSRLHHRQQPEFVGRLSVASRSAPNRPQMR